MPYQSISRKRHNYLQRDYLGNRSELVDPIKSYHEDLNQWARTAKKRMHEHCQCLLKAAANPRLLAVAINKIGRYEMLGDIAELADPNWFPWDQLRNLQKEVLSGSFRRGKYRKAKIPKSGKEGFRTIKIPDDSSRILSRNLCTLLTPMLDPNFYDLSIGFRPRRSLAHGIAAAKLLVDQGKHHMVVCDVKDAFGSVPKVRLLKILRSRLHQSPVLGLIEELLDRKRKWGIPQGLSLSPLCLNVYLDHYFDRWWNEQFPDTTLVRYADDIAVFADTKQDAVNAYGAICQRLQSAGLQVKESQHDAIYDLTSNDHVQWLGFNLKLMNGDLNAVLGHLAWDKLQASLLEIRARLKKNKLSLDHDVSQSGCQWLVQKSMAIHEAAVPAVADQIRQLAAHVGLNMAHLTAEEAHEAWSRGQEFGKRAEKDVSEWMQSQEIAEVAT